MRRCELRPMGNKVQLRWRPSRGAGAQVYVAFASPEEDEKAAKIRDHINNVGCEISKDAVLALKHDVSLETVLQAKAATEPRKAKGGASTSPFVEDLVEPYLRSVLGISASVGTVENYRDMLANGWLRAPSANDPSPPTLRGMRTDQVTGQHIRDVIVPMAQCACQGDVWGYWCARRQANRTLTPDAPHEPGVAKRTRDRYFSAIRGLFHFAVAQGHCSTVPTKSSGYKTESLATYNQAVRREDAHFYLTKEQSDLLCANMPQHMRDLLDLDLETGMRFSELMGLQVWQFEPGAKPLINLSEVQKYSRSRKYADRGAPKGGSARKLRISTGMGLRLEKLCAGKGQNDLIFKTARGKRIVPGNFYRDVWKPALLRAMRCPEHPPVPPSRLCELEDLAGPRCGDNGGKNARGGACGFPVSPGTNRCYSHQGLDRDAVSTCDCTDPKFPRRLPRRLTVHDLRHTYNAWMKLWNIHPTLQAERLGHSPAVNFAVYGGTLEESWDDLVQLSARR